MDRLIGGQTRETYAGLLRNADFRRWFWSSLGSSLGDWVGLFALQVLVVSLADPGSRLALFGLGGIMMARLLPSVVFGPFAGVIADRFNRTRLMQLSDVARAILFTAIAFSRNLVVLFALTVLVESFSLVYITAKNAVLPQIVGEDDLVEANQLTLLITYGPLPFGAAVAAFMAWLSGVLDNIGWVQVDSTTAALLLNALTFAISALLILRLRSIPGSSERTDDGGDGPIAQLRSGVAFIRHRHTIRALILGLIGVFFGAGVIITLGPELVRSELGGSAADWYGLMTTVGFGLLAGMVLAPAASQRLPRRRILPWALSAAAALALATAFVPSFRIVQLVGFALGALSGLSVVVGYTMLHQSSEDESRARTFAAFFTGTRVSLFAALGLAPFLAGAIGRWTIEIGARAITLSGLRATIALGGAVALVSAVLSGRGMQRDAPDPEA